MKKMLIFLGMVLIFFNANTINAHAYSEIDAKIG